MTSSIHHENVLDNVSSETSSSSDDSDYDDSGSDISYQSMPEMRDLETFVMKRYTSYHPKDIIPTEEKLVALALREFNDHFYEEEETYEDENDVLQQEIQEKMTIINSSSSSSSSKKKKKSNTNKQHKKEKERVKELKALQERLKGEFLQKKDQLEKYYSQMVLYAINDHVAPPEELVSIKKLLLKNPSTLHAIIIHLNHFSYIDSDLEEDSDEELPDMDSDDELLINQEDNDDDSGSDD